LSENASKKERKRRGNENRAEKKVSPKKPFGKNKTQNGREKLRQAADIHLRKKEEKSSARKAVMNKKTILPGDNARFEEELAQNTEKSS